MKGLSSSKAKLSVGMGGGAMRLTVFPFSSIDLRAAKGEHLGALGFFCFGFGYVREIILTQ